MRLLRCLIYEGEDKAVTELLQKSRCPMFFHNPTQRQGVSVVEHFRLDISPAVTGKQSALSQLRDDLNDNIDGAEDGNRAMDANISKWLYLLDGVETQLKSLQRFKASVDEALNSGDGVYRP